MGDTTHTEKEAHPATAGMRGETVAFLLYGRSRTETCAALVEYRKYAAEHPDEPISWDLLHTASLLHDALHYQRHIRRMIAA